MSKKSKHEERMERILQQEAILKEIKEEDNKEKKKETTPAIENSIVDTNKAFDDFIKEIKEDLNDDYNTTKNINIANKYEYDYNPYNKKTINTKFELNDDHRKAIKDELLRLLKSEEVRNNIEKMDKNKNKNKNTKKTKKKMEFSKKVTIASVALVYMFIVFVCYLMYTLQSLEPVAYIGAGLVIMLAICVKAYMKRAYQQDLVNMKVNQSEKLSELKVKFGDNFVYENIDDINLDGN